MARGYTAAGDGYLARSRVRRAPGARGSDAATAGAGAPGEPRSSPDGARSGGKFRTGAARRGRCA